MKWKFYFMLQQICLKINILLCRLNIDNQFFYYSNQLYSRYNHYRFSPYYLESKMSYKKFLKWEPTILAWKAQIKDALENID